MRDTSIRRFEKLTESLSFIRISTVLSSAEFQVSVTLQMEPGDKIFVYTDGVPEATATSGEMFGLERMTEALNVCADGSPDEILRTVKSAVDEFVGDAEPFDDMTMMCLEYKGVVE